MEFLSLEELRDVRKMYPDFPNGIVESTLGGLHRGLGNHFGNTSSLASPEPYRNAVQTLARNLKLVRDARERERERKESKPR